MAQPSSTHRERSSSHHHHRTISSTTLLLVLSLILAVLSVMLSIPRSSGSATDPSPSGILGIFSPKRNQEVISREAAVAERESEVAKREADILNGIPAGVTIGTCLPCAAQTTTILSSPTEPVTIIKEIIKEVEVQSPPWYKESHERLEEVLERESRVTEREKEVGRREEIVGKRETDASRRETWIMENLITDGPTEEYVTYEDVPRRPSKEFKVRPPPPSVVVTETETKTVIMPAPTNTRLAANPSPEITSTSSDYGLPTTVVEFVVEETEPVQPAVTVVRKRPTTPPPSWW